MRTFILQHRLLSVLFIALACMACVLRFWQIETVPFSFYHDEMDYVFTGESILRYGTDVTGNWKPSQLRPLQTLNFTAELPAIFHAAAQFVFGTGPRSGHYTAAFFGVLTVLLVTVMTKVITGKWLTALWVGAFLAINPWHVYISRLGYEAVISLFFQVAFLSVVYIATQEKMRQSRWQQLSLILLLASTYFLAFFTYHAAKFTMIALAVISVVYVWRAIRSVRWKGTVVMCLIACMVLSGVYMLHLQTQSHLGNRASELIFSAEYLQQAVNTQRRLSIDMPLSRLVFNKGTVLFTEFFHHYAAVFDVYRIFISGYEGGFQFSLMVHGFFFGSTLLLIPTGLFALWQKHRQVFLWLVPLILLSPVSSAITITYQSIFRSALCYLLLIVVAGFGAEAVWQRVEKRKRSILLAILASTFVLESGWFGYQYFTRYPILAADNHYFSELVLSSYLDRVNAPLHVVVSSDPYSKARSFIAYSGKMDELSLEERQQFVDPGIDEVTVNGVSFSEECPTPQELSSTTIVIEAGKFAECNLLPLEAARQASTSAAPLTHVERRGLSSPLDSHTYYWVVNDPICQYEMLPLFIRATAFSQYDILSQENADFCSTWMKRESTEFSFPAAPKKD